MKCKYYEEKSCSKDCTEEWAKCSICKEILEWSGEDCEMNGYQVYAASISCCDEEMQERVMKICPNCFEIIKKISEIRK